jgi:hypothetical protein
VLEKFLEILQDTKYIIQHSQIPFLQKEGERPVDHFYFKWSQVQSNPEKKSTHVLPANLLPLSKEKNASCQLCPKRLSPIKSFFQKGNLPVLVLHYTGEIKPGGNNFFKKPNQIFRTIEAEDLFDRLVKKVFNCTIRDLYFQEFPACVFNYDNSLESDWKSRLEHCTTHVEDTIQKNGIKGVIITGSAAVLYYGNEKAREFTGKIQTVAFGKASVPLVVLRSPEGILSIEQKRKKLEVNKSSKEFISVQKEEAEIKINIIKYMQEFKNRIQI